MSGAALTTEVNRTIDHLVAFPRDAKPTVGRDTLRSLLLYTEGWVMANGLMYDVRSEHLGAGIYRVWLEER